MGIIGFLVWRGVLIPQNILPSLAAGNPYGNSSTHFACADLGKSGKLVKLNDNHAKIRYSKDWGYKKGGGGSQICYQEDYHFAPDFVTKKVDVTKNYHASMEFTFIGNQVGVRFIEGGNRGSVEISIDGDKVDTYNANTGGGIYGRPPWVSPDLSCGEHTIKIEQSDVDTSTHGKVIVVDYVQYRECVPNNGQVCAKLAGVGVDSGGCRQTKLGQSCAAQEKTSHAVCINNSCALSETAVADDQRCLGKGIGEACGASGGEESFSTDSEVQRVICGTNFTCQISTTATANDLLCGGKEIGDSCGIPPEELICQGNTSAPARCFDCKRDNIGSNTGSSEINILDFSCFAKYYGKEVGKN